MNRYPKLHSHAPTKPVAASFCGDEFLGRTGLRQVLSRLGLRADRLQENTLLDLIHQSHCRKQFIVND